MSFVVFAIDKLKNIIFSPASLILVLILLSVLIYMYCAAKGRKKKRVKFNIKNQNDG